MTSLTCQRRTGFTRLVHRRYQYCHEDDVESPALWDAFQQKCWRLPMDGWFDFLPDSILQFWQVWWLRGINSSFEVAPQPVIAGTKIRRPSRPVDRSSASYPTFREIGCRRCPLRMRGTVVRLRFSSADPRRIDFCGDWLKASQTGSTFYLVLASRGHLVRHLTDRSQLPFGESFWSSCLKVAANWLRILVETFAELSAFLVVRKMAYCRVEKIEMWAKSYHLS